MFDRFVVNNKYNVWEKIDPEAKLTSGMVIYIPTEIVDFHLVTYKHRINSNSSLMYNLYAYITMGHMNSEYEKIDEIDLFTFKSIYNEVIQEIFNVKSVDGIDDIKVPSIWFNPDKNYDFFKEDCTPDCNICSCPEKDNEFDDAIEFILTKNKYDSPKIAEAKDIIKSLIKSKADDLGNLSYKFKVNNQK